MIDCTYDHKREGYWVRGMGFNFFAYCTKDEDGTVYFECDSIEREGIPYTTFFQARVPPNYPDLFISHFLKNMAELFEIRL